jgi:hypothetical protein
LPPSRWGEAVKIYDKPALGYYKPHPDDFKEARQALVDIIALFDTENPAANGDFTPQNAMDNDTLLLEQGNDIDKSLPCLLKIVRVGFIVAKCGFVIDFDRQGKLLSISLPCSTPKIQLRTGILRLKTLWTMTHNDIDKSLPCLLKIVRVGFIVAKCGFVIDFDRLTPSCEILRTYSRLVFFVSIMR